MTSAHHRRPRVLLTDAETRAAVATVRGLAGGGFDVVAAAPTPTQYAAAQWSRAVSTRLVIPDPITREAEFVDALERVVSGTEKINVLMAGGDASLDDISRARGRLEPHVRIGLPGADAVRRCLDKLELAAAASRHGLQAPPTITCSGIEDARRAALALGLPVLVKPPSSVIQTGSASRRSASMLVRDTAQLPAVLHQLGDVVLVQQHVAGSVVSFAGVYADGRLLGEAVSRYHRTWEAAAGNACYSETIEAPGELRERVTGLLSNLGWEGLFELELIESASGAWHAIDFNPRPYGSLALAVGAGANLPAIWCRHLLGEEVAPARAAAGVFYRWTDADVRHGLWQLRQGGGASAARALSPRPDAVHPYLRSDDPGPGAARMLELGTKALGRVRRRAPDRLPTVVIGAGPYGLAASAHLRALGVETVCFGEPMEAWVRRMPAGMLLRSRWRSSHIADPRRELTLDAFSRERDHGLGLGAPQLTREEFIDYGRWFARRAAPEADGRRVASVARDGTAFHLRLHDGDGLDAERVVVAAGLAPFADRPDPFRRLSDEHCSHAYDHDDLSGFAGRRVAVIGSGQSALECAALLHEHGASASIICRTRSIHWLSVDHDDGRTRPRGLSLALSPPPTDVGGRLNGWIAAAPDVYRIVPQRLRPTVSFRCIRPAGAAWLRPRIAEVPITFGVDVLDARERDGEVVCRCSDGSERRVDHVLLGTGYRVDVRRYPFLSPEIARELALVDGSPVLGPGLESSIPGLHFMGAPAAHSFGPITRFVVGTWYAAPALARRAAGRHRQPIAFAFPSFTPAAG